MALIADKALVLNSFKMCAINGWLDKDFLLTKLQLLVMDETNNVSQGDIQPIVDILIPPIVEQPIEG